MPAYTLTCFASFSLLRYTLDFRHCRHTISTVHSLLFICAYTNIDTAFIMTTLTMGFAFLDCFNLRIQSTASRFCLPWPRAVSAEHDLNLFQRLAAGFRIGKECLYGSAKAQGSEDEEGLIRDVGERRWDE